MICIRLLGRRVWLFCLVPVLALAAPSRPAQAADYYWDIIDGGSFNWKDNWWHDSYPYTGVPGSADKAIFELPFTYTVTFSADVTNSYLYQTDGRVLFDLDGSTYALSGAAYVARNAGDSARLTVHDGTVSTGTTRVGYAATADGTLTVTGATWSGSGSLSVGDSGTGTLEISNGGKVSNTYGAIGVESGSNGILTVSGAGSTWTSSNNVFVGQYGTGTLNIQYGAVVEGTRAYVGDYGGTGTVTVNGSGSSWNNSSSLRVGSLLNGTGTLNIQNGGAVSNTSATLAYYSGSRGTATVDGPGSTWTNSGQLSVGEAYIGILNIQNGGMVSNTDGYLGYYNNGNGTVTVTGTDSTWTNTGSLYIGGSWSSDAGTGTLTVGTGGTVNVDGTLKIWKAGIGPSSVVNLNGGTINTTSFEKDKNTSTLNFNDGTLSVNGGVFDYGWQADLSINGAAATDLPTLQLTSGASTAGLDALVIGENRQGALVVNGGSGVSSSEGAIGKSVGSSGTVTVEEAGSTWTNTGSLYVGGSSTSAGGTGSLYVNNGATVSVADTLKIWGAGSVEVNSGVISSGGIENAGSLVNNGTISGDFTNLPGGMVGGSGVFEGTVTIGDGSLFSPGNSPGTTNWSSGVLEGGGGFVWEIKDAEGIAGTDWDFVGVDGLLTINATASNPFLLDLRSLLPNDDPGLLTNFDNTQSYSWTFLTAKGGINGFSSDYFLVDYSGFDNDLAGGSFSVRLGWNSQGWLDGWRDLDLEFSPALSVPEPSSLALLSIGALCVIGYGWRRKRKTVS